MRAPGREKWPMRVHSTASVRALTASSTLSTLGPAAPPAWLCATQHIISVFLECRNTPSFLVHCECGLAAKLAKVMLCKCRQRAARLFSII